MTTVVIKKFKPEQQARSTFAVMVRNLELQPVYNWLTENMAGEYEIKVGADTIAVDCFSEHDAMFLSLVHGVK